jgi:hypothetical protein
MRSEPSVITKTYMNRVDDGPRDLENSVMALYKTDEGDIKSIPSSQYVFEQVSKRCRSQDEIVKFISDARKALPNNPSWQGWVTEFEIMSILRLRKELVVFRDMEGTKTIKLKCSQLIELQENEELKPYEEYEINDWLVPYKWNQAVWNAGQVLEDGCLGIRQIMSGESDKSKISHAIKLIEAANPQSLQFLIICRQSHFENDFTAVYESLAPIRDRMQVSIEQVWYEELVSEVQQATIKKRTRN